MAATDVIHFPVGVQLNPRRAFPTGVPLKFPSTPSNQTPPVGPLYVGDKRVSPTSAGGHGL